MAKSVKWYRVGYTPDGERMTESESRRRYGVVATSVIPGVYWTLGIGSRPKYRAYRQVKGRAQTKTFNGVKAAEKWKNERPEKPLPAKGAHKVKLEDLFEELHTANSYSYAPATIRLHRELWSTIRDPLGDRPISKIDVAEARAALESIKAPAMKEKTRSLLSVLFGYAIERELITSSPVPERTRRKRTRAEKKQNGGSGVRRIAKEDLLTEPELAALVSEIPEEYQALVRLMARVGLRPGEAFALQVAKFDPIHRRLVVNTSATGDTKTGEARVLVLPAVVSEMLVEHVARHATGPAVTLGTTDGEEVCSPLLFPGSGGGMIDPRNWRRRVFEPALRRAGIAKRITPNWLRHQAASFAINHGANVLQVQRMLGHSRASVTLDIYSSIFDNSLEKLAEELDTKIREEEVSAPEGAAVVDLR